MSGGLLDGGHYLHLPCIQLASILYLNYVYHVCMSTRAESQARPDQDAQPQESAGDADAATATLAGHLAATRAALAAI
jgi:hypothetical protein